MLISIGESTQSMNTAWVVRSHEKNFPSEPSQNDHMCPQRRRKQRAQSLMLYDTSLLQQNPRVSYKKMPN